MIPFHQISFKTLLEKIHLWIHPWLISPLTLLKLGESRYTRAVAYCGRIHYIHFGEHINYDGYFLRCEIECMHW